KKEQMESPVVIGRTPLSDGTLPVAPIPVRPQHFLNPDLIKEALKNTTLAVEIPPYRNQRISSPVQVNFYVCNGKRKRSQYQRFTYVPANGIAGPMYLGSGNPSGLVTSQMGGGSELRSKIHWLFGIKEGSVAKTAFAHSYYPCTYCATWLSFTLIFLTSPLSFCFFFPVPIIKTEPTDEYDSLGIVGLSMHSKPYYGQARLTSIMPVAEPDPCLVGGYPPCPPCHAAMPPSSPSSSPTLHNLSPVAYNKCLPNSPTHVTPPGSVVPRIQETPCCPNLPHPSSPDHNSSLAMLHSQGSPDPLGYHHSIYANSSSSSSPVSDPSTPGGPAETPFFQTYSPSQAETSGNIAQAAGNPPSLLTEDTSPPSTAITIKQEPQELDQMYLDDGELLQRYPF
ncbi:hypothetical protein XENOCAPTIV_016366, partial [Xenoophorus captivus]